MPNTAERVMEIAAATAIPDSNTALPEPTTIEGIVEAYKLLLGMKDELNAVLGNVKTRIKHMEHVARNKMDAEGVDKLSHAGLTLYYLEKPIAKVDPAKWEEIQNQLRTDGFAAMISKTLSGKKLNELFVEGYRLPDGLTIETITQLRHRRST